ncbi:hypothetical protein K1719_039462 [Acacia pycnantha]|nr:hypothetical protein K1719_039462 [Acacia pycnantha]
MPASKETTRLEFEKQRLLKHHTEKYFTTGEIVRDIIISISDGLTVPFVLAASLFGANASSSIVLIASIAEVTTGAISMGLDEHFTLPLFLFSNLRFTFKI